jgi:hypothetical protein
VPPRAVVPSRASSAYDRPLVGQQAVNPDNPATRLHRLLKRAVKIPDNTKTQEAWAQLLRVQNAKDTSYLLSCLGPVLAMPHEVKETVLALNLNHELMLRWVPKVEQALSAANLAGHWEPVRKPLDDATLINLEMCGDRLSELAPEPVVPEAQLGNLLEQVRALRNETAQADIDPDVKQCLLKHLHDFEYALECYDIGGTPAVRRAVGNALGDIVAEPKVVTASKTSLGKKFVLLVAVLAQAASATSNVLQIGERINRFLIEPPPVLEQRQETPVLDGEVMDDTTSV